MSTTVVVLAFVVAVAAAARSTWSPCGQSMLSQITPIGEASRGHRYRITATWYVVGAIVGGATLGVAIALLASGVRRAGAERDDAARARGGRRVGRRGRRQRRARLRPALPAPPGERATGSTGTAPYVYALGFGWQIGTGVTTYMMTAAVFVTVAARGARREPAGRIGGRCVVRVRARHDGVAHGACDTHRWRCARCTAGSTPSASRSGRP